jgi:WD40 repeat protein
MRKIDALTKSPEFYSSDTIVDASRFGPPPYAPTDLPPEKNERRWTRRALLLGSGVLLGALGMGGGYAAYNAYFAPAPATLPTAPRAQPTISKAQPTSTQGTMLTKARLQATFTRHTQTVRDVAWSPGGALLASGADDGRLFSWSADGVLQHTFSHFQPVRAVTWSPDGNRLVAASGNQVFFYNGLSGARLAQSGQGHRQRVNSVAWSTHGQMYVVSGGVDRRAVVWDSVLYRPLITFELHTTSIDVVALSADGQSVASASQGGAVRVWNAANGEELHGYYQDADVPARALSWSPGAAHLAVGSDDGFVHIWDNGLRCQNQRGQGNTAICMDTPQSLRIAQVAVRALAWSPDGHYLAAGTDDGVCSVWSLTRPQKALLTIRPGAPVLSIAWSPDSNKLATAYGKTISIWVLS